jgi:hypothetical protein
LGKVDCHPCGATGWFTDIGAAYTESEYSPRAEAIPAKGAPPVDAATEEWFKAFMAQTDWRGPVLGHAKSWGRRLVDQGRTIITVHQFEAPMVTYEASFGSAKSTIAHFGLKSHLVDSGGLAAAALRPTLEKLTKQARSKSAWSFSFLGHSAEAVRHALQPPAHTEAIEGSIETPDHVQNLTSGKKALTYTHLVGLLVEVRGLVERARYRLIVEGLLASAAVGAAIGWALGRRAASTDVMILAAVASIAVSMLQAWRQAIFWWLSDPSDRGLVSRFAKHSKLQVGFWYVVANLLIAVALSWSALQWLYPNEPRFRPAAQQLGAPPLARLPTGLCTTAGSKHPRAEGASSVCPKHQTSTQRHRARAADIASVPFEVQR